MDKKSNIIQPSGYDDIPASFNSEIITEKKQIMSTGTTCEAFSGRYGTLHVFVKRLKPEHVANPRYRMAFRKEYELGVTLRHNSIPIYLKCTCDTLIMDFVDGKTLYQMEQEDDLWLRSDRNIEKWVDQLLDVMDYLHRKNVIHCDLKEDNIMITNETRNLMLIDFDKAFTAGQDLTPGTPLNYGTKDENLSKRQMDIRGVRNIIEKLTQYVDSNSLKERLERVAKSADLPEVTIPELLEIWKQPVKDKNDGKKNSHNILIKWGIGMVILISLIVIIWSYLPKEQEIIAQTEEKTEEVNPVVEIPNVEVLEAQILKPEKVNPPISSKESKKLTTPDWNSLLLDDVAKINKLLEDISTEISGGKIESDKIPGIVMQINDEMYNFNSEVGDKYSQLYPDLSRDQIIMAVYESQPVKNMVKRRDNILQQLLDL